MDDCVFCNIVNKTIEAEFLFESKNIIAIKDILPKAPVHFLVMPKKHIVSVAYLAPEDEPLIGEMVVTAKELAKTFGISESGYKLVFNIGKQGGMIVPHLHLHVLGGKQLPD